MFFGNEGMDIFYCLCSALLVFTERRTIRLLKSCFCIGRYTFDLRKLFYHEMQKLRALRVGCLVVYLFAYTSVYYKAARLKTAQMM